MKPEELLLELSRIVSEYMKPDDAREVLPKVERDKVKYVLVELDIRKIKPISDADHEIIRDLAYYFV